MAGEEGAGLYGLRRALSALSLSFQWTNGRWGRTLKGRSSCPSGAKGTRQGPVTSGGDNPERETMLDWIRAWRLRLGKVMILRICWGETHQDLQRECVC